MNTEDFGKKILSIRQNANFTQEELALRIGVTPQAISKWERGGSPSLRHCARNDNITLIHNLFY